MNTHANNPTAARFGETHFRIGGVRNGDDSVTPNIYPTCSFCGSIEIKTALEVLQVPGTHYSGTDWKYGWPSKFRFDVPCEPYRRSLGGRYEGKDCQELWGESRSRSLKFRADHFFDATDNDFLEWDRIAAPLLGIRYWLFEDESGTAIGHSAPAWGFQTWGYVNGILTPGHHEAGLAHAAEAPKVPTWFLARPLPTVKPEIHP